MRRDAPDGTFDPGAALCGHVARCQRVHYLGGGLWVCLECVAKLLRGEEARRCK